MTSLAPDVKSLIAQHAFLSLNERGKVHCSVTAHDLPPRVDAILAHLSGKTFKKAQAWYDPMKDISKYAPWIVPHKSDPKKLYCRLTSQTLNRIPAEVEAHMAGRRFRNRLALAEKEGTEVPASGEELVEEGESEDSEEYDEEGDGVEPQMVGDDGEDEDLGDGIVSDSDDVEEEDAQLPVAAAGVKRNRHSEPVRVELRAAAKVSTSTVGGNKQRGGTPVGAKKARAS